MSDSKPLAVGHYSAFFVTLPVPCETALGMIPSGLELGEQSLTPSGSHPLLLMFGHHTNVHPAFLKIRGWSYHEFLVAVPWVRRSDDPTTYSTMPRLYLDNWPMVVAGWVYAFPKVRARVSSLDQTYDVRSLLLGRQVIEATWTLEGASGPSASFPNFSGVEPTFKQPFIQRVPPLPFERSVMTFDLDAAVLQAAVANVTITKAFLPGLPTGPFSFPSITDTPLGSFTISVPWTLGAPGFTYRS